MDTHARADASIAALEAMTKEREQLVAQLTETKTLLTQQDGANAELRRLLRDRMTSSSTVPAIAPGGL